MSFPVYYETPIKTSEIKNDSPKSHSTIEEKEFFCNSKKNLNYIPDLIEDQMLCFFQQKEFINSCGRVDKKKISNKKLPLLGKEELLRLNQMVNAFSPILIPGYDLPSRVNEIPAIIEHYLREKYQQEVHTQLVGSAVFYILGISYVLKAMQILEFEDFSKFLTSKNLLFEFSQVPKDVDFKIFSNTIEISDCIEIKEKIVRIYAQRLKNDLFHLSEQECCEIIHNHAFKNVCYVNSNLDHFYLSLQSHELSQDYTIIMNFGRTMLFSKDAIQIPLGGQNIAPESDLKGGWQALVSRLTKTICIPDPETVNHLGWLMLISYLSRSYTFLEERKENNPEPILRNTLLNYCSSKSVTAYHEIDKKKFLQELAHLIAKVLINHHGRDKNAVIFYLLNACVYLKKNFSLEELQFLCSWTLNSQAFANPIMALFAEILAHSTIPFEVIEAYIVLAGNMRMMDKFSVDNSIEFTIRPYIDVFGLQMRLCDGENTQTLLLPNDDINHSMTVITSYWEKASSCDDMMKLNALWKLFQSSFHIHSYIESRIDYLKKKLPVTSNRYRFF